MGGYISEALTNLFSLSGMVAIFAGVAVGLIVGILPGLGQGVALLLTLPIALSYPPEVSLVLYAALLGATDCGGSITSVILGVPGTAQNLTTVIDGYPMSRSGHAGRAIGLSVFSSLMGSLLAMLAVVAAIPFVQVLIYVYGSREYFLTVVLAAVIVSIVASEFFKGMVSFCVGFVVSLIGTDYVFGVTRYTGGVFYLWGKIPITVFIIGLFALTGLVMLESEGQSVARGGILKAKFKDTLLSVTEVLKNWKVVLRSSVIGLFIGMIPGVGGTVAQFVSYGAQKSIDKNNPNYGNGEPRGIIASEASNSAKDSGTLLPALCLGIPGGPEMAILLGIFLLLGINPGPGMLQEHGDLVWLILLAAITGYMFAGVISIFGSPWLSRITTIPIHYVFAVTLPLSFAATYCWNTNIWDCVVLGFFCIIGLAFQRCRYPLPPLILGFVLGPLAENSFHTTLQSGYYNPAVFLQSKTAIVLIVITALIIVINAINFLKKGRKSKIIEVMRLENEDSGDDGKAGPLESLIVISCILVIGIIFMLWAPGYDLSRSGLFPFLVSIVLTVSAAIVLIFEIKKIRLDKRPDRAVNKAKGGWRQYFPSLTYLFSYIVLIYFAGMYVGTFLATVGYFKVLSKKTILKSLLNSLIIAVALYILFDVIFAYFLWPGACPMIIPSYFGGGILRPFF